LPHPLKSWPREDETFEESLISCGAAIFLEMPESARCTILLKDLLEPGEYAFLAALLAGIKASHIWIEAHPEISSRDHPVVQSNLAPLIQSEPALADRFQNHKKEVVGSLPGLREGIPEGEDDTGAV